MTRAEGFLRDKPQLKRLISSYSINTTQLLLWC